MEMDSDNPNENYQMVVADEVDHQVQPYKRRKKKSVVWEHFTIEYVGDGCRRAFCNECKQSFAYSTGSKVAGTSHLKRHIPNGRCAAILRNELKNPNTPFTPKTNGSRNSRRRYKASASIPIAADSDHFRHSLARMMIMHDYDLHMVEHSGFVDFLQNLQPFYESINFSTLQGDCIAAYLKEKYSIMSLIESVPGRISLAIDIWESPQSTGYVFLTGYYFDSDWKPRRRLLNVVMEPFPESESAISHAIAVCLSDWGLENKLFSVTVNHPITDAAAENLRTQMSIKRDHILGGQLLIRNCIARTLSSMVIDLINAGQETVKLVRDNVKYVKMSASREEKFFKLKQQLQIPSERTLTLDNLKWNTTYEMLMAAFEHKEVFSCLDTFDPDYKEALNMEQWKQVETLCTFMKLFYDTATVLRTSSVLTSNCYFHEICKIQMELARAGITDDPFVSSFFRQIQEKFEKLWKDSFLILATAVVIDPRFKMKLVEFSFTKIYGEDADTFIKLVDEGIHALFQEYEALPLQLTPTYDEEGNLNPKCNGDPAMSNLQSDFDVYIKKTNSQQSKSELDKYLEDSLCPRNQPLDVCNWWNLNKTEYPTLSKMARDILSIPLSTLTNESVFDTAPKVMDPYRSSLRPEAVEAIICAKNWFLQEPIDSEPWQENPNSMMKMDSVI